MIQTAVLTCTHIHVHTAPGRTDGFISNLQSFIETLFGCSEDFDYAELHLSAGEAQFNCYWMGSDRPEFDSALTSALENADEIDLHLNLCSEADSMDKAHEALYIALSDGSLSDCVRMASLKKDDCASTLTFSGMHRGAFCHGEVPFCDDLDQIPEALSWNSSTHRAHFHFPEENVYDACCIADLLPERIDMIDFEFFYDDAELFIHSLQLSDRSSIEVYRDSLEQLAALSDSMQIDGVLTPESDSAFALMRFVPEGGQIAVQIAAAEF